MQKFALKRLTQIAPGCGEDLGGALADAANNVRQPNVRAQVLFLAAEAFEAGAAASIGHNRADRYEARARELRRDAEGLIRKEREAYEAATNAQLLAAFDDGYAARSDGKRHHFERREAFQLGQHFAKCKYPMPQAVRYVRDDKGRHHFEISGERWTVDYPNGKVDQPVVAVQQPDLGDLPRGHIA